MMISNKNVTTGGENIIIYADICVDVQAFQYKIIWIIMVERRPFF